MPLDNPDQPHKFEPVESGLDGLNTRHGENPASNILLLTMGCPHNLDNPSFCPLHEIRKLEPCGRIRWVQRLTEGDLEYLSAYHEICLHWRSIECGPCPESAWNDAIHPSCLVILRKIDSKF